MADLTAEQAIEKLRNLPEEKQRSVLSRLSPDQRKGILDQLRTPRTLGERYMAARRSGELPQKEVTSFFTNPQQALGEVAQEAGERAQQGQNEAAGIRGGAPQFTGSGKDRKLSYKNTQSSLLNEAASALNSGTFEMVGVGAKLLSGLTDWKTAAAFLVSKLSPQATAAYFATAGAKQVYDSLRSGKATPDNVQNFLLGLSTVSASFGAGSGEPVKTPAEIKQAFTEKVHGFARHVTEAKQGFQKTVAKAGEEHAAALDKNRTARAEAIKGNAEARSQQTMKDDLSKIEVADKNKAIEAENASKQQEFESNKTEREQGLRAVDEQSKQLGDRIKAVEEKVAEDANRKFEAVRAKVGNAEARSEPLIEAVGTAKTVILQNIPENIKEFNAIMDLEGSNTEMETLRQEVMTGQGMKGKYADLPPERQALVDQIAQNYGGQVEQGTPVTWDKLQALKTRLDARLRSRSTAPIVKRALGYVRDRVVDTMGTMAEQKGATAEWDEAKTFWRRWKEDFWEPTGPMGTGSPVAEAVEAIDPKRIRQAALRTHGPTQNRFVDILNKYGNYGGTEAAELTKQMIDTRQAVRSKPSPVKEKPTKAAPEVFPQPKPKEVPSKLDSKTTVDAQKVALKQIADTAGRVGRLNAWDFRVLAGSIGTVFLAPLIGWEHVARFGELGATYVASKFALSYALENQKLAKWIANTPPAEVEALAKLPHIDKVNVTEGLTQLAIKAKVKQVSPPLRAFLGPQNVAKILAGSTANRASTPGEARERMRQLSPAPQ